MGHCKQTIDHNETLPFILGIVEFASTWHPFRSTHSAGWIWKIYSDIDTSSCWRRRGCLCQVSCSCGECVNSSDFDFIRRTDKEFRKTLVETVPAIDPVLKVLLQEEGNAVSEAKKSIDTATQKVIDAKDTVAGFFGAEEKPTPPKGTCHSVRIRIADRAILSSFHCFSHTKQIDSQYNIGCPTIAIYYGPTTIE